jgi:antirestriction protein ArdC
MKMNNAIETVNRKLTELIDGQDSLPWSKPWTNVWKPVNGLTGSNYTRGNLLFLMICQLHKSYTTGIWLTFHQVMDWNKKNAGEMRVRKGEHGAPVIVPLIRKDDEGESELIGATYKTVFNLDQLDAVPVEKFVPMQQHFEPLASMDSAFAGMPNPPVYQTGGAAYYTPKTDIVTLPGSDLFRSVNAYYLTKAH